MIRLVGPGGAGKTTVGAVLADALGCAFVDLDREFGARCGDISEFIAARGYDAYARRNVEVYHRIERSVFTGVMALSSGFMTYPPDAHPSYSKTRADIARNPETFVLLPSLEVETCVAEIVRRQLARPFGRTPAREEAVIRERFGIYVALPAIKIETMRSPADMAADIRAELFRVGSALR